MSVQSLLTAYDLSGYLSAAQIASRIDDLAEAVNLSFDHMCGRDFERHTAVTLLVDGTGTNILELWRCGVFHPVTITSVTEGTTLLDTTVYRVYPLVASDRTINSPCWLKKRRDVTDNIFADTAYGSADWSEGEGNISIVLSYGPTEAPADVLLARDINIATMILAEVSGAAAAAEGGQLISQSLGDFSVSYDPNGRYGMQIGTWCQFVEQTAYKYSPQIAVTLI